MIAIRGMEKIQETCSDCDFCHGHICKRTGADIVANPKMDCPLVEIVTCKNCKSECTEKNGEKFSETRPDFYCADAERKE